MLCVAVVEGPADTSLWSIFTAKAELVGAVVMRTSSQDTAAILLNEASSEFACTASVARRFPRLAQRAVRQSVNSPAEVVAIGKYAVAETGSVALDEPAADRGACFLADRLWLLVAEQEIVPTLDVGLQRMHDLVRAGSRHPLLMTGPSRTADIERVLTIGVHGPRALSIVIVGQT